MSRVPSRDHFVEQTQRMRPLPPLDPALGKLGTLVLDLDETLVHSSVAPLEACDYVFTVDVGTGQQCAVFSKKRPYCDTFLQRAAALFEIVVYTASKSQYADMVLDFVDPQRLISHRVFREHCVEFRGNLLKDLAVLNRDLSRTVIVDNSPQTFAFQPDNGIPIESWFADPADNHLVHLMSFLERLSTVQHDWRAVLRNTFGIQQRVQSFL